MSFNFVILFQTLSHFQSIMLSTTSLLFVSRHSIPIMQCNCYFPSQTTHPTSTPTYQQNRSKSLRFQQLPTPLVYSYTTSYQHTLRPTLPHNFSHKHKIVFPSTFFTLCLLITQVETLPPSHKMSSHFQQI